MDNSILKINYYKNGQFKGSEGVSIFQSSNEQSTLQFKFAEDLGANAVVANILIPYPVGSNLYGQYQTQSLIMKKVQDPNGGFLYTKTLEQAYLATSGKAYVNAQVYASEGYIQAQNAGRTISLDGNGYIIYYQPVTFGDDEEQVTIDMLILEDANTGKLYFQNTVGCIVVNKRVYIVKEFVASVDGNNDFNGTLVLQSGIIVKNYQQIEFKIEGSAPYYSEYPLTPEESYVILQAIANIEADVLEKQDKIDNNISNPDDKSVVGNINKLLSDTSDLPAMRIQIEDNTEDIEDLKIQSIYGWNIVGTLTLNSQSAGDDNRIPTDNELKTFIEGITGQTIQKGDACFVYWNNFAVADATALFWYNGTTFKQVPYIIHSAENGISGTIEGTKKLDLTGLENTLMIDIVGGKVVDIQKVNSDATGYVSLKTTMDSVKSMLIDGNPVPKATADRLGRQIDITYPTTAQMKKYTQDYASPKALYDLSYADYATGLYKNDNVADSSYQKLVSSSSIGDVVLATLTKVLDCDILLGNQNGVTNKIYLQSTISETIQLRITTSYIGLDSVEHQLGVELTPAIYKLGGGQIDLFTINTIFDSLNTPITIESGSTIKQVIEVVRQESTSVYYMLLSNTTYSSYMTFNKIGFVRYSLEEEPDAIEMGADSATMDGDGNLQVGGDGIFNFANGVGVQISTINKIPMAGGITQNEIKPPKAGDVYTALVDKADVISIGTSPITDEQLAKITSSQCPILQWGTQIYILRNKSGNYYYFISANASEEWQIKLNTNNKTFTTEINWFANESLLAPIYDYQSTYALGDLATHYGKLYKCSTAITTPEHFNANHWTQVDVSTLLTNLDSKKLDKQTGVTANSQLYGKQPDGTQAMFTGDVSATPYTIPYRDSNSQIAVALTPTANGHATSKKYVDDNLINKLANKGEVEFNQLFENESSGSQSLNGITRVTTPYTYKISGTATATDYIWAKTKAITSGHKFYFANLGSNEIRVQNYGMITTGSAIVTPTTAYLQYAIDFTSGQTYNVEIKPILIDLTTMFGSGAEPDLATCQAIFSADYYAYESGKTCMLVADNNNNACFVPKGQVVIKNDLLDMVYPIGSIYMSVNNTSPATLFGGTWVALNSGNDCKILVGDAVVKTSATSQNTNGWNAIHLKKTDNTAGTYCNMVINESGNLGAMSGQSVTGNEAMVFDNLIADTSNAISVYMWQRTA